MRLIFLLCLALAFLFGQSLPLDKIRLPEGFSISIYQADVFKARQMSWGRNNTLYVGSFADKIYAIPDSDGNIKGDGVNILASSLWMPVGVDYHRGDLYVSSVGRILKLPGIDTRISNPPKPVLVNDKDFPDKRHHGWKFIKFGPDGKLYIPIGAPCNICLESDPYASITRINPDGSGFEIIARGIRNSVGFDWHPTTHHLWFTDNGRDWLGNDLPPEELNEISFEGEHFGFPFIHGKSVIDPEFGRLKPPKIKSTPPRLPMGAHTAALGMRFYTGKMFPPAYHNAIFIAQHGSWNRDTPDGYRILVAFLDSEGSVIDSKPFAEGWLNPDGSRWGRPVDVEIAKDGSLLISDDYANVIYRIIYQR